MFMNNFQTKFIKGGKCKILNEAPQYRIKNKIQNFLSEIDVNEDRARQHQAVPFRSQKGVNFDIHIFKDLENILYLVLVNLSMTFTDGVKGILTDFIKRALSKFQKFEFIASVCSASLNSIFPQRN